MEFYRCSDKYLFQAKINCPWQTVGSMRNLFSAASYSLSVVSCLLTLCFPVGCSTKNPEEVAAHVARQYYEQLFKGDYASFVDGTYQPDSIPSSYREKLIGNSKLYVDGLNAAHHGVKDIRIVDARADTVQHSAHVFLLLSFKDSTEEEIVVPMVLHENNWYLK